MNKLLKKALIEIDFVNRYNALSNKYPQSNLFDDPDAQKVQEIISSFGYSVTFNPATDIYEIMDSSKLIDMSFTAFDGVVELELNVLIEDSYEGGSFSYLSKRLKKVTIPPPRFNNYEELAGILKESVFIYADIRDRLLPLIKE
ncbi:MAG: hypothetical protein ACPGJS_06315 [Flammeovirgaceae bacterium]